MFCIVSTLCYNESCYTPCIIRKFITTVTVVVVVGSNSNGNIGKVVGGVTDKVFSCYLQESIMTVGT